MKRRVTCPESGTLTEIEYLESPEDGHILGIVRCSQFHPVKAVTCDQLCRHRLNERLTKEGQLGVATPPAEDNGAET